MALVLLTLLAVGILSTSTLAQQSNEAKVDTSSTQTERICGWFENPTPANAWLTDRHGEWIIGLQGGYQAEGSWPEFDEDEWVRTNIHYGYGCACLDTRLNKTEHLVVHIFGAMAQPLNICRRDKAIVDLEPAV
ncbi:DUF4087 domain-containing protein [Luteimonas sp. MJ293]|uniref:DUF4087 domain-containing protein n=1 Tax=Luteimonas sp. MJ146 TaxID=3129240 RepID=UPI0031BB13E9